MKLSQLQEIEILKQQIYHILKPQIIVISKQQTKKEVNIQSNVFRTMQNPNKCKDTNNEIKSQLVSGNCSIDILDTKFMQTRFDKYEFIELYLVSYATNDEYFVLIDEKYNQMETDKQDEYINAQMITIEKRFFSNITSKLEIILNRGRLIRFFPDKNEIEKTAVYHCILKNYESAYDLLLHHKIQNELFFYLCIILNKYLVHFKIKCVEECAYLRQLYFILKSLEYRNLDIQCVYNALNRYETNDSLVKAIIEFHLYQFLSLHNVYFRRMKLCLFNCVTIFNDHEIYDLRDECIELMNITKLPKRICNYIEGLQNKP